jgi:hypothetical protein
MQLTSFASEDFMTDWLNAIQSKRCWRVCKPGINFHKLAVNIGWVFIQPTFDNGDKTDDWCDTYLPVPSNLLTGEDNNLAAYGDCGRTEASTIAFTDHGFATDAKEEMDHFLCV